VLSDEAVRSWLFGHKLLFGALCGAAFGIALLVSNEVLAAVFALVFTTGLFFGMLVLAERVTARK
jgi:hypothetical protein